MSTELIKNEYGFMIEQSKDEAQESLVQVEQARAIQEVQAAFVIAKKFPRDQNKAYSSIMNACKRPFLADRAIYAYPRGGQSVTGPSIRLAEVIAQNWGNIQFGVKELVQKPGSSVAMAYAIDLETNVQKEIMFHVEHSRDTKQGKKILKDQRDIYEMIANQGSRRLRNCILAIIPGDIVDAAVDECKKTQNEKDKGIPLVDRVRKMVEAFKEFGVSIEQIEENIGCKLDAVIEPQLTNLRAIYQSLKDGMARREDFFNFGTQKNDSADEKLTELVKGKKETKKQEPEKDIVTEFFEEVDDRDYTNAAS